LARGVWRAAEEASSPEELVIGEYGLGGDATFGQSTKSGVRVGGTS
jgi:hypothetical protein